MEAKGAAARLVTDLAEARSLLQAESDELDVLKVALSVVCDDLQVVKMEATSSLVAYAIDIIAWVHQLEEEALRSGITQAFAIACSHYDESINLEAMSLGFVPSYEPSEMDEIEAAVTPLAKTLASKIEDMVLP